MHGIPWRVVVVLCYPDVLPRCQVAATCLCSIAQVHQVPTRPPMHLQAVHWLRCTYFYVRVKHNCATYGVPRKPNIEALDCWLKDRLVLATISELAQHGMVRARSHRY